MELEERAQRFLEKVSDDKQTLDESVTNIIKGLEEDDSIKSVLFSIRSKAAKKAEEMAVQYLEAKQIRGGGFELNGNNHQFVLGVPEIRGNDFQIDCVLETQRERGSNQQREFEVSGAITISIGDLGERVFTNAPLDEIVDYIE